MCHRVEGPYLYLPPAGAPRESSSRLPSPARPGCVLKISDHGYGDEPMSCAVLLAGPIRGKMPKTVYPDIGSTNAPTGDTTAGASLDRQRWPEPGENPC